MDSAAGKELQLAQLAQRVGECTQCDLCRTRSRVVFGSGSADARIMFVGEAPGYHEDHQGIPFVGQAGKLLDELLMHIGLKRQDIYIANVLKCRPPDNRDPQAEEISLCRGWLEEQISIIRPSVICTLGNFATKLLSGKPEGITLVRGRVQPFPEHDDIFLFPVFHPAAALYTRSNLAVLRQDFKSLGELIGIKLDDSQAKAQSVPESSAGRRDKSEALFDPHPAEAVRQPESSTDAEQLGLF
ncbi:MAG: uracil-DNA glycosylase [Thermoleophilia bacterium]